MDEFVGVIICLLVGLVGGLVLEFCIVISTLNEGEYITFKVKDTIVQSENYYIKNIEKINEEEYKLLIKKRVE